MLFNSIEYMLFLPIVFILYWAIDCIDVSESRKVQLQNAYIVLASYIFYGWWDWRFLLLIAFTSLSSWGSGLLIAGARTPKGAKLWMTANIVLNVGILALFKYYDFFAAEFCRMLSIPSDGLLLRVILPVGISFYTFQALSYSIDVYRRRIEPTGDIIAFFAFISFFPQLVAGPIERATNLLPQFQARRTFSYEQGTDGLRQILWGLFKKIVIADTCATYVDQVWSTYSTQSASTLLLAAVLFTFQIYGDFSGYSDIAIGSAKLFGIRLMRNFNNPYFSRDIAEFWRRWHISLTTWFRDYVYIPLGGSRPTVPAHCRHANACRQARIARNTFFIFLVSGIWHGANWTFIAWGAYHALLFLPLILLGRNRKYTNQVAAGRILPSWREAAQIVLTFALVTIGWIIFRAPDIADAWVYTTQICSASLWSVPLIIPGTKRTLLYIGLLLIVEWLQRDRQHALEVIEAGKNRWFRVAFYYLLIVVIIRCAGPEKAFIYFQF